MHFGSLPNARASRSATMEICKKGYFQLLVRQPRTWPILLQHLISPTHYRLNFLLAGPALCRLSLHLDLSAAAHQCLHGLSVVARHAMGPPRRDNLDSLSTRSIGRRRTHHSTYHQVRINHDFIIFVLSGHLLLLCNCIISPPLAASIHISFSLLFLSL